MSPREGGVILVMVADAYTLGFVIGFLVGGQYLTNS